MASKRPINLVDVGRVSTQGLDCLGREVQLFGSHVEAEVDLVGAVVAVAVAAAGQLVRLEGGHHGLADVLVALVLKGVDSN